MPLINIYEYCFLKMQVKSDGFIIPKGEERLRRVIHYYTVPPVKVKRSSVL
jgi:hypothetical protein